MEKIKIAIASVLKPLKDPRAYCRMGLSLRETNKYRINIIGFSTKKEIDEENLKFIPLFCHFRTHWKRALIGAKFMGILLRDTPQILILSTYELMVPAILLKPFLRYKIIYDLQENYSLNLAHNKSQKGLKKHVSIGLVKAIETVSSPFVDHYFFAEKCYTEELKNIRNFTVLENRFHGQIVPKLGYKIESGKGLTFLISGTLTEVYGTLEGILWFQKIQEGFPNSKLRIVGHAPLPSYLKKIKQKTAGNPAIESRISESPLPYSTILESYKGTDFSVMPYHLLPSIAPKIPSKLYESLALGVPVLLPPNAIWADIYQPLRAGLSIDFLDLEHAGARFSSLLEQDFFTSPVPESVLWKSQEPEFLDRIRKLSEEQNPIGESSNPV
ncbi:hypothetical protein [Rhodonellum sp.]|uniref:hypothetical protein n=1 Tax=Rhodonellum sp. TaxID=2231180 RepID=UPI002728A937|nr:hypothetical protein [Rhodonellum sp.]MDO9552208.1 hypothetical protein [Rhodonellum sp.]